MSAEEHAAKLEQLNLERNEVEKYILANPYNAGQAYCHLLDLRAEIESERFRRDWETQVDPFAFERQ